MARSRNIKPGFFANEILAELDPLARLLFIGLWTLADREGRLEDRPKRIKAEVLPYDSADANGLLSDLANGGFITRYEVNGCKYIQVSSFLKHQMPHHKEVASVIPAPSMSDEKPLKNNDISISESSLSHDCAKNESSMSQASVNQIASCPTDSLNLIPDSLNLIPDSLNLIPLENTCSQQTGVSAEPESPPAKNQDPILLTILVNTGREWPVTQTLIDQMTKLYPAVNTMQEFRNMSGWAIGNPKKRKTAGGMMRFINSWMAREQNKGGSRVVDIQSRKPSQIPRQSGFAYNQDDDQPVSGRL